MGASASGIAGEGALVAASGPPNPTVDQRQAALVHALSHVLWTAGKDNHRAVVVTYEPEGESSGSVGAGGGVAPVGMPVSAVVGTPGSTPCGCSVLSPASDFSLAELTSQAALQAYISSKLGSFATPAGVMQLVYSALLSRGIEQVVVRIATQRLLLPPPIPCTVARRHPSRMQCMCATPVFCVYMPCVRCRRTVKTPLCAWWLSSGTAPKSC